MKKRTAVRISVIAVLVICIGLFIAVMSVFAFYLTSFEQLNNLNIIATTRNIDEFSDSADVRFPKDVLIALKVTTDDIAENEYVQFKTKHNLPKISFGKIEYNYDIKAQVMDDDSWDVLREYTGHRTVLLAFDFSKMQWVVEDVK